MSQSQLYLKLIKQSYICLVISVYGAKSEGVCDVDRFFLYYVIFYKFTMQLIWHKMCNILFLLLSGDYKTIQTIKKIYSYFLPFVSQVLVTLL